jgi:hypothetical protein
MPVLEVQESKTLPPGNYTGTLGRSATRESTFRDRHGKEATATYLDVAIEVDGHEEVNFKGSFNFYLTEKSDLGKLLARFGASAKSLKVGKNLNTDKFLAEGTRVQFAVVPDDKDYGVLVRDSLTPLPDEEEDEEE